jgi:tetratricopeptide (TPR) repeat protein
VDQSTNNPEVQIEKIKEELGDIEVAAWWFLIALLFIVAAYAFAIELYGCPTAACAGTNTVAVAPFFLTISVSAVTATAAGLGGAFMGFLFGIPRVLTRDGRLISRAVDSNAPARNPTEPSGLGRAMLSNSNLEEISDWLTKIIVGVTLINAGPLLAQFDSGVVFFRSSLNNAPAAGEFLMLLAIASAMAGFLFLYLETRTRITILLGGVESDSLFSRGQTEASKGKPLVNMPLPEPDPSAAKSTYDVAVRKAEPLPGDANIISYGMKDLRTASDYATWGAAQARAGNYRDAETALRVATERNPTDLATHQRLAEVQLMQQDFKGAVATLSGALKLAPTDWPTGKQLLLAALWMPPPDGFTTALEIVDKFKTNPQANEDPWFHIWHAAALGQKYKFKPDPTVPPNKSPIYLSALEAITEAKRLAPGPNSFPRRVLKGMLHPETGGLDPDDDDLTAFADKTMFPEIDKLIMD